MSRARDEAVPVACLVARLHNRRIRAGLMRDGSIAYRFKRLRPDGTIQGERLRVSIEALGEMLKLAQALYRGEGRA